MTRRPPAVLAALCASLCAGPAAPQEAGVAPAGSPRGGASFRFAVLGDNQPHSAFALPNKVYGEILDRINECDVDFAVNVGDVVAGYCSPTTFRRQIAEYIDSSKKLKAPCHIAFGNHDMGVVECREDLQRMLGQPLFQSFVHKGALFILLNSNVLGPKREGVLSEEQYEWLSKVLEQNEGKRPIFVFIHHPVLTAHMVDGQRLHRLLLRHGVTGVFSGHEHLYNFEERDGIKYYTTGGAGGPLFMERDNAFHHFLLVEVDGGNWRAEVRRVDDAAANVFRAGGEMQSPLILEPFAARADYEAPGAEGGDGGAARDAGPHPACAHISAGNLLLRGGEYSGAVGEYAKALSLRHDDVAALHNLALARTLQAMQWWSGDLYLYTQKSFPHIQEINEASKKAIALETSGPRRARILNNYAVVLWLGGLANTEVIEDYLNGAIASDPGLPEPYVTLGNIQWETQRVGPAGLSYLKALALDPSCSAAKHNLATILVLDGKVDEGIDTYRELLARDPSFYRAWNSLAEAHLYRHKRNPAGTRDILAARDALEKSLRINPSQLPVRAMAAKIEKEHPGIFPPAGSR